MFCLHWLGPAWLKHARSAWLMLANQPLIWIGIEVARTLAVSESRTHVVRSALQDLYNRWQHASRAGSTLLGADVAELRTSGSQLPQVL